MSDPTAASPTSGHMPPRVRIAPSPTGDPHVGTAYIALFNFAFARKHAGKFVLRIEDTDQARSTQASERAIFEALRWLGVDWDEGPDVGGPCGPYRQSERTELYREHAEQLLARGSAYRCFCSRERLDLVRQEQVANKQDPRYDGHCRGLDPQDVKLRVDAREPHVIRLAIPSSGTTVVHDGLRGEVSFENRLIDDQVLLKSDGFPTYHLANVVDDHLMKITHVIRGEDWLVSTPKHLILFDAFGWDPPQYFHLGLLRNLDRSRLSKRKNSVSVFHYRNLGYLPHTFLNFLATIGFSIGEGRERFSLDEMVEAFEWSHVSVGGPVFDPRKLEAFSGDDIRALDRSSLKEHVMTDVLASARIDAILRLCHERLTKLDDFVPYAAFFFGGSLNYDAVIAKVRMKDRSGKQVASAITKYLEAIEKHPQARGFEPEALEAFSREFCGEHGFKPKEFFSVLRIGATGRTFAPPLFDTLSVLGKDRVRMRLRELAERVRRESI